MNFPGTRCHSINGTLYILGVYAHDATDEAHWWTPENSLKFLSVNIASFVPTACDVTHDLSLSSGGALKAQFFSYRHWNESGKNEDKNEYHNLSGIVIPAGMEIQIQATSSGASNIIVYYLVQDRYLETFEKSENQNCDICDSIFGGLLG